MNQLTNITQAVRTMSSREIAALLEKQHSNIKISAERLAASGVIGTLAAQEFTHNGNSYAEYLLTKRDSLILVAQNCPEFTARIVDRWQELEGVVAAAPALPNFADPVAAARAWADAVELATGTAAALSLAAPKAKALDRLTLADGAMCITNAAKSLGVQPKHLFSWMQENDWIYRRPGSATWVAYQQRLKTGVLDHKVTTVEKQDGSEKIVAQVLVTAKGLARLAELVGEVMA